MITYVQMLANMNGETRPVTVPDHLAQNAKGDMEKLLGLVFYYGQNDFQPLPFCSVSVGDVIELTDQLLLKTKYFIVRPLGFAELSEQELDTYKQIPRRDRAWSEYARP